jgi:hypothetical protein
MIESTTFDFPHIAPESYSYEFEEFNSRFISIWLIHSFPYSYTTKRVKSIWGFYSPKKKEYYAPINSSKVGERVDIKNTRNYTAMPIKLSPLEQFFV